MGSGALSAPQSLLFVTRRPVLGSRQAKENSATRTEDDRTFVPPNPVIRRLTGTAVCRPGVRCERQLTTAARKYARHRAGTTTENEKGGSGRSSSGEGASATGSLPFVPVGRCRVPERLVAVIPELPAGQLRRDEV